MFIFVPLCCKSSLMGIYMWFKYLYTLNPFPCSYPHVCAPNCPNFFPSLSLTSQPDHLLLPMCSYIFWIWGTYLPTGNGKTGTFAEVVLSGRISSVTVIPGHSRPLTEPIKQLPLSTFGLYPHTKLTYLGPPKLGPLDYFLLHRCWSQVIPHTVIGVS